MTITTPRTLTNVWVDLECTGLDHELDAILEIGAIGTDENLDELFEFTSTIRAPRAAINRMRANPYVRPMHLANGLFDEVTDPASSAQLPDVLDVEAALIEEVMAHQLRKDHTVILSGSGVSHYDIRFLKQHMPALSTLFSDREFCDTGQERRAYLRDTGTDLAFVNDLKPHRALDDVRLHLEEGRIQRAARQRIVALSAELVSA
ncbi:exonuclease domain-containing protein [Agromyces humi]|uniref:exonuclease domain-containing protein n=1 Tax=Agromyces humi TaxID=1766800 RepID=UPI00135B64CF|nr:exonuclease domain-containing protein [Agromyces humi]